MADMIARLKVDSSEYDSKIQRAAKGIQHLAEACHNAGAHLNVLEDENREYIQSLGNMATVATTARGKIAELTSAFIDIKSVYNSLSQEEKNGEFGKELNKQLDIMKGRIQEGKRELADINNEINGGGGLTGALDSLAGKFGMNIKQLAGWGTALTVAKGALDVAKDAFFASETSLDEWGRTVQSSQSLYQGFLSALNNSDISGFLSRMDEIVSAARDAYDAMDELGTFSAFQQRNVAKGRAGYAQALDEYRLNPTADNKQKLAQANQKVMNDLRESHDKTEAAYQAALRQIATERISGKGMQDAFVKMFSEGNYGDFQAAKSSYKTGRGLNSGAQYYYGDRVYDGRVQDRTTGKWRDMSDTEKQQFEFARALSQVNDSQIKEVQALGAQSVAITEQIYQQDRAYNRLAGNNAPLRGGGGRGGKGGGTTKADVEAVSGSIDDQTKLVQELQKAWRSAADDNSRQKIKAEIEEQQYLLDRMTGKEKFDPAKMKELTGSASAIDFSADMKRGKDGKWYDATAPVAPSDIKFSDGLQKWLNYMQKQDSEKKEVNLTSEMSKIAGGVSGIFSGIESLGVELPQGLKDVMGGIQGMISILTSISTIVTAIQAISAADTLIPFARGGVVRAAVGYEVPGNHFSGDLVPALLNSGETVLNRAQSGIIASALEGAGNGFKNGQIVGRIEGEKIVLVANHFLKRTGQGELVTWRS